jgi:hypothetical protein
MSVSLRCPGWRSPGSSQDQRFLCALNEVTSEGPVAQAAYMRIAGHSEADIARQLVLEHGRKKALQVTVSGRMKAKRARSRREYQFWADIYSKIELLFPISCGADAANTPKGTSGS